LWGKHGIIFVYLIHSVRWRRSVVENVKVVFRSGFNPDPSVYVYLRKIMRNFGNSVRVLGITVDFFFQRK